MQEIPRVFFGSSTKSSEIATKISELLASKAECVMWTRVFEAGDITISKLVQLPEQYDFAVLIFAPDDTTKYPTEELATARDNVVMEFGLFVRALGLDRTVIVRDIDTPVKIPSDLAGVTWLPYNGNTFPSNPDAALMAAISGLETVLTRGRRHDRPLIVEERRVYSCYSSENYGQPDESPGNMMHSIGEVGDDFIDGKLQKIWKWSRNRCRMSGWHIIYGPYGNDLSLPGHYQIEFEIRGEGFSFPIQANGNPGEILTLDVCVSTPGKDAFTLQSLPVYANELARPGYQKYAISVATDGKYRYSEFRIRVLDGTGGVSDAINLHFSDRVSIFFQKITVTRLS